MVRCALLLVAALAAAAAAAQHRLPSAGVLFDDFHYRNADPPVGGTADRPLAENALFGANTWCLDLACAATTPVRAWYWYNWYEGYFLAVDSLSALTVNADGPGTLDFTLRAGRHHVAGTAQRQIASGFAARTGVWAALVEFSALPNGLPPDLQRPGGPVDRTPTPMMQSFWQISPAQAIRTPDLAVPSKAQRYATTELDFEFNNWFYDAGRARYMATGYFENGEDPDGDGNAFNAMPLRAASRPGGAPERYTCLIERTGAPGAARPATYEAPETCEAVLAGVDRAAGPHVPALVLARVEGARVRFELRAAWSTPAGRGVMRMETPWSEGPLQPSQLTTAMFSFYLTAPEDSAWVSVPTEQRMRVDWAYYTPDAGRTLDEVAADVALVRSRRGPGGRPVSRLYTVPDADPARSIGRPYRPRAAGDRGPSYEPVVATEPLTILEVAGPRSAPLAGPHEYVAVLGRRAGDYRFEWRYAPLRADGTAGAPGPYEGTSGFRWRPSFRFAGPAPPCVRVDLRVTRLEYHSGPDGVWWTPILDTGRDRAETSFATCAPGQAPPRALRP